MKKLLLVIDMQNDFITGTLGSDKAQEIVEAVKLKTDEYRKNGDAIIFTRDTHTADYMKTQEGRLLPVPHCIEGTDGHLITPELETEGCEIINKCSFGSLELAEYIAAKNYEEIELCGLCTDICVVSNALILKARLPEVKITVDQSCCAGVSEESHKAALLTMKMCHVEMIGESRDV
ncbi:MAG: cysteine hydrolase [Oscillospiraceae bacterium]|nr:cysteine hydrolase [Oscillospiraceae bacterium]